MSRDELQQAHEKQLDGLIDRLSGGTDSDWALVRALVHRAVHLTVDRRAGEFCALATLLAEMIQHAHDVMHPTGRPTTHAHQVH